MGDTIAAIATAMGTAGIHIIRLSGLQAEKIINRFFKPNNKQRWDEKRNYTLHLGLFNDGENDIDQVLVSRMRAPSSFTGEDVYEINCHGGNLIAKKILEACLHGGARLAEPGEFSKRAFMNGKIDLIQAEAIIDLISAKTDSAAKLAFSQLEGGLSLKVKELRDSILDSYAFIEAGIDFPEDEVENLDRQELLSRIKISIDHAEGLIKGSKTGKVLREGLKTVIVGRPNVGKSSLLNAILREDRAIVTDIPGTTRDEIHEAANIGGVMLQLIDTAGIRESNDVIEKLGIERTRRLLPEADLILLVVEANVPLVPEEINILNEYSEKVIVIANKCDLIGTQEFKIYSPKGKWLAFSVKEGKGFSELEKEILLKVYQGTVQTNENLLSNIRQINAINRAHASLISAQQAIENNLPWDIISIDIRQAMQAVAEITGEDVQESLLEDIFSRFCIGK